MAAAILIFCFSSTPHLKTNLKYDFILRKIIHVTEYFILAFLSRRAFEGSFHLNSLYLFFYPARLSLLYAISDEIHQWFVPGRHGCVRDILIDAAGILGFYIVRRIFKENRRVDGLAAISSFSGS